MLQYDLAGFLERHVETLRDEVLTISTVAHMRQSLNQRLNLTFKANLQRERYGWLRLPLTSSAKLVQVAQEKAGKCGRVLAPLICSDTKAGLLPLHGKLFR